MVDLDGMVVDVCKKELPSWNAGSTEDPRLDLRIGDARSYLLEESSGTFDVVVLDISDPIEAGPAVHLYTQEFYELVAKKLNPGGVLVTQSGPAGLMNHTECFGAIHQTLKRAYSCVVPCSRRAEYSDESRRRRGWDADRPWRRVAAGTWRVRGGESRRRRGRDVDSP